VETGADFDIVTRTRSAPIELAWVGIERGYGRIVAVGAMARSTR
jgi:hypothetical protein